MVRDKIKKVLIYGILILGAIAMMFPFYWMLASAVKTAAEYNSFPPVWVPGNPFNMENFIAAFQEAPFGKYFINSIFITIACVCVTGFTTILGAFAFSRLQFRGRDLIFSLLLSLMMVPFEMMVITNYQTITKIGLANSYAALIVPFATSIFYTYILRNFFLTIPDSLYYSARIDGATNWQYLWKIMVPIAKPSLVTIMLLNAISCWNSFMWTQLIITSDKYRTLPLGLFVFMSEAGSNQQYQLAAASVVVLPMIILFIFCRKYIVNGVARGGIKG